MAGTVVEWYEFFLYGTAATLVFNKVFFPESDSAYGAIFAAFLTYAVGFVARPLGGVVFGHFGDKFGRKKLLQFAILLVGAVTFLMGCLPTYAQIGIWAPTLLVVLRFLQGSPSAASGWRRATGGRTQPEPEQGLLGQLAAGRGTSGQHACDGRAVGADRDPVGRGVPVPGWRVAFWLSAVVVLIGYYIRTKVSDAPIFLEAQQEVERVKAVSYGVVEVLKRYPRGVFTAMGLRFAENIMYYLVVIVSITYLKVQVGVDTNAILRYMLVAHAAHFLVIPFVGKLADRYGRRPVYLVGTILAATWGSSHSR